MKSYTIHFIRHGIAEGNLQGKYIGITDSPLAKQGVEQLEKQKEAFGYPHADVCYTSPLSRCVETCRILYPDVSPIVVEGLKECNFGDWEGRKVEELKADPAYLRWMKNSTAAAPPNGENGAAFIQRVCATFEKLVEDMMRRGTTSAVIVTHGGAIMSILSAYGLPRAEFSDWIVENGCGYTIRITPGLWMRSMVAEVVSTIPEISSQNAEYTLVDAPRKKSGVDKPEDGNV